MYKAKVSKVHGVCSTTLKRTDPCIALYCPIMYGQSLSTTIGFCDMPISLANKKCKLLPIYIRIMFNMIFITDICILFQASILDLHSGALSKGNKFVNIYK